MKRLKLKMQHLDNAEVLTRSQLKNVLGGSGMVTPTPPPKCPSCKNSDICTDSSCPTCVATGNENDPGVCGCTD